MKKDQIITAMRAFIAQRSGINYQDYGDRAAFMQDYRKIQKAGQDARVLLAAVSGRNSITAENIIEACRAFSGRLQIIDSPEHPQCVAVDYTTGQYFPTEYRNAACAVLATALWAYAVKDCPEYQENKATYVCQWARKEFGRGIASRWFN